ncbi:MAG: FAD-dependent oxidoreductase [Desulfobacter sp.]|nr:MAG: FAD-dependent oxidoreductase [Desulfobacter sp.]
MLAYEASNQGKKVLVLEKDRFGSQTSSNSLRIIHGGLRYLQKMHLRRFFESVAERQWFLQNFRTHVFPMKCLMPLYNRGLHRPGVLRAALLANDILSNKRNRGLDRTRQIPNGKIISPREVIRFFPRVDRQNLTGGAVWTDAFMPDPKGLMDEVIYMACRKGVIFHDRVKVNGLKIKNKKIYGVKTWDLSNGDKCDYLGKVVVNTAGPWCRNILKYAGIDEADFFYPSLAWNVLFNRPALGKTAIAVTPIKKNARTYFIVPLRGRLLAGTGHQPWDDGKGVDNPQPSDDQIRSFISDINTAVPGLSLTQAQIVKIYSGILPAERRNTSMLKCSESIIDHKPEIKNFYSISGVKFTTSRKVAQKALKMIY